MVERKKIYKSLKKGTKWLKQMQEHCSCICKLFPAHIQLRDPFFRRFILRQTSFMYNNVTSIVERKFQLDVSANLCSQSFATANELRRCKESLSVIEKVSMRLFKKLQSSAGFLQVNNIVALW